MAKSSGTTRASSKGSPRGLTEGYRAQYPSIYTRSMPEGAEEGWYAVTDNIRGYVMTREARDWGATNEPWIIRGGNTISVELQRNGEDMYTLDFTYDGEGKLPGIYKTRAAALKDLRAELKKRFNK